jgi:Flp pilus assembly protein TadB
MRQNPAQQHRTGRSSGKGASAYRAASRRRGTRRGTRPVARSRTPAIAAGRRRSRQPLLVFALVACVAGTFAAVFANIATLVALFALVGLVLSAVVIRAEG